MSGSESAPPEMSGSETAPPENERFGDRSTRRRHPKKSRCLFIFLPELLICTSKQPMKKEFYRHLLPHFQQPGQAYFVTWSLKDAVPKKALKRYTDELDKLRLQIKSFGTAGATGAAVSKPLIKKMSGSESAPPEMSGSCLRHRFAEDRSTQNARFALDSYRVAPPMAPEIPVSGLLVSLIFLFAAQYQTIKRD